MKRPVHALPKLAAAALLLATAAPEGAVHAQIPIGPSARKELRETLPKPKPSRAWNNPGALERGSERLASLWAAAGGLEAWRALPGIRFDELKITRSRTINMPTREKWRVHHYEPRLVHLNNQLDGYIFTEFVDPETPRPQFRRVVLYDRSSWAEMGGTFFRTEKARRTARADVQLEYMLALMPFSLHAMGAEMAFVREEQYEDGPPLELYAMRFPQPLLMNYYPMIVKTYDTIEEFHVYVDPETDRVVQVQYAFPDKSVGRPPYLRWVAVNFEGTVQVGGIEIAQRRDRFLDDWPGMDQWTIEDVRAEAIPPAALRRPWQSGAVYEMPYRADHWDPPGGVPGLTGFGSEGEGADGASTSDPN